MEFAFSFLPVSDTYSCVFFFFSYKPETHQIYFMLSFPPGRFLDWHLFIHTGDGRKNQCSGQREDKSNCHSLFVIKKME